MADLDIDTELLVEAGSALRVVANEFEHANAHSDEAAGAVGHEALADRVREFAHSWDDRRGKMLERIAFLAEAATGTGQTFDDLETSFVASLRGEQ